MTDKHAPLPNSAFDDYATSPVPQSETVNGIGIGMINGGLAFAVPGLITGIQLGGSLGLEKSIFAFLLGGFALAMLGTVTGLVGMHNRFSSCMTIKFVFGTTGANFINLAFVVSLLGWYGVNVDLFSQVSQQFLLKYAGGTPDTWLLEVLFGVLITAVTIWGFKVIERITNLLVPILFAIIVYLLVQSIGYANSHEITAITPQTISLTFGEGVSAVVGSFIVSVVLMPDFSRYAAKPIDTVYASFLPFLLINSFVYVVSAFAGIVVANSDILSVMLVLGLGGMAFFLLLVSSCVTNVINLYSCGLGLMAVFPKFKEWQWIIVAGILGTVVASFNVLDNFTNFLFGLSIIFTPVAAIYVVDFFLIRQSRKYQLASLQRDHNINYRAVIAWLIGICTSFLSNHGWLTITTIEVFDAMLVTLPVYYLLSRSKIRRKRPEVAK
ncbi:MAG: cytosine permease [Paraglaciecola polaris]|uniref:purine-cytosine permease family protein n=1 Tax=Paraglaciecola polaris TaxID=222814 RepID=UPI0030010335|tara:strand:+ start:25416 stop:26732 length:1317 start_codon:yes stop_codon:yes gene_type:complete